MTEKINLKLKSLYEHLVPKLTELIKDINNDLPACDKATNPLLLQTNESYLKAKTKIMFFGQETNYWHIEKDEGQFHGEIEPLVKLYETFYLKGNCFSYSGYFWNGIKRFMQLLESSGNSNYGFIWNNVIKIGKCGKGKPNSEILNIQQDFFRVIKDEIEILKPDYLVFFSGPNYDYLIKKFIEPIEFQSIGGYEKRQLCKIETSIKLKGYRTYHPRYLCMNGIDEYLNTIINEM